MAPGASSPWLCGGASERESERPGISTKEGKGVRDGGRREGMQGRGETGMDGMERGGGWRDRRGRMEREGRDGGRQKGPEGRKSRREGRAESGELGRMGSREPRPWRTFGDTEKRKKEKQVVQERRNRRRTWNRLRSFRRLALNPRLRGWGPHIHTSPHSCPRVPQFLLDPVPSRAWGCQAISQGLGALPRVYPTMWTLEPPRLGGSGSGRGGGAR